MKNGFLISMWVLLLTACQQPTVYVFSENLQDEQRKQLDAALKAQNLPYEYVALEIPSTFGEATLLLSSDKIYPKETEQLAIIMQELGYQPEINYTTRSNHFYGDGNIGFYLKSTDGEDAFTMPSRLRTIHCSDDKYNDLAVRFSNEHADFTYRHGVLEPDATDLPGHSHPPFCYNQEINQSTIIAHDTLFQALNFLSNI